MSTNGRQPIPLKRATTRPRRRGWTTYGYGEPGLVTFAQSRSEEHTSELQSQSNLVCRLLLEKKKVHAGGGAVDRRGDHRRRSEGHDRLLRAVDVGRRPSNPHPSQLLTLPRPQLRVSPLLRLV